MQISIDLWKHKHGHYTEKDSKALWVDFSTQMIEPVCSNSRTNGLFEGQIL